MLAIYLTTKGDQPTQWVMNISELSTTNLLHFDTISHIFIGLIQHSSSSSALIIFISFTESYQLRSTDAQGQKVPTTEDVDVDGVPTAVRVLVLS